ncbi:MAG: MOSC N-terminal beta barrel domain-containing protein [Spirochaetia bacterium]|nr:MOSC N-terminal beta barrel domain-containing protein [Spirochaetia bacterium]
MPSLGRIRIYPIKSLDHMELREVNVGYQSLKGDREFAMVDSDGQFVNGKRTGRVCELHAEYDLVKRLVFLTARQTGELHQFHLDLRFRANLELQNVPPFWEERLFLEPGVGMRFRIGEVTMIGINPRARCNVPPRHPLTGATDKLFVKSMMTSRTQTLPADSMLPLHGNMYHLTVNTFIPDSEQGRVLRVGDKVQILDKVALQ